MLWYCISFAFSFDQIVAATRPFVSGKWSFVGEEAAGQTALMDMSLFSPQSGGSEQERTKKKRRGDRYSVQTSLIVAALKKLLPIGLNMCSPADQELINLAKIRYSLVYLFTGAGAGAGAVLPCCVFWPLNPGSFLCRKTPMKR